MNFEKMQFQKKKKNSNNGVDFNNLGADEIDFENIELPA